MDPAEGREKAPPPPGRAVPCVGPSLGGVSSAGPWSFCLKGPSPRRPAVSILPDAPSRSFTGSGVPPARPTPRGSPLPQGPTPRPPPVASASRPPEEGEGSDKGWGSACLPGSGPRGSGGGGGESARFSVTSAGASGRRPGHQSPLCRSAAPAAVRGADRAGPRPPTSPGLRGTGNRPWGEGTGHTRSCEAPVRVPTPSLLALGTRARVTRRGGGQDAPQPSSGHLAAPVPRQASAEPGGGQGSLPGPPRAPLSTPGGSSIQPLAQDHRAPLTPGAVTGPPRASLPTVPLDHVAS